MNQLEKRNKERQDNIKKHAIKNAEEETRKAEEARIAEEARKAEETRIAEEARKAEETRKAEEELQNKIDDVGNLFYVKKYDTLQKQAVGHL